MTPAAKPSAGPASAAKPSAEMTPDASREPSVRLNALAAPLVASLGGMAAALRIRVERGSMGELLIDAGAKTRGGIEAGLRIAEICMGGLGKAQLAAPGAGESRWAIGVHTSNPVLACLASQYAGWSLNHGTGEGAYHVLGSGPGRAVAAKEEIFHELKYREDGGPAIFVLEAEGPPPPPLVEQIARDCQIEPRLLTFIYAPTSSLAGAVQVVARVLEVALHKAHTLKFPLDRILDGMGTAPLPPPSPDFVTAMGRTNDAIIFGGRVHLYVTGPEGDAKELAESLPSRTSKDFGTPFAEAFKAVSYDFYKIDPMLFSPAAVTVTAMDTGRSFAAGSIAGALLDASFGDR